MDFRDLSGFMPDFAVDAVVAGVSVRAMFDNGYDAMQDLVAGSSPKLLLASSAASAVVGDSVTVDGHSFRVTTVEPDGTGVTRLRLEAR